MTRIILQVKNRKESPDLLIVNQLLEFTGYEKPDDLWIEGRWVCVRLGAIRWKVPSRSSTN